jgi:hypothetical protein
MDGPGDPSCKSSHARIVRFSKYDGHQVRYRGAGLACESSLSCSGRGSDVTDQVRMV